MIGKSSTNFRRRRSIKLWRSQTNYLSLICSYPNHHSIPPRSMIIAYAISKTDQTVKDHPVNLQFYIRQFAHLSKRGKRKFGWREMWKYERWMRGGGEIFENRAAWFYPPSFVSFISTSWLQLYKYIRCQWQWRLSEANTTEETSFTNTMLVIVWY